MPARIRASKSFRVAPGVKFRVNAKSTSVTVGGKGIHYTVNSSGRRTTTVKVPGMPLSAQDVTRTPRAASTRTSLPTPRPAASRAVPTSKPGLFAPKGERQLYQILATDGLGPLGRAQRCDKIARQYPRLRVAALTLAGLFSLGHDYPMAIRTLEEVYATGIEVANDKFLRQYSPIRSFPVDAIDGSKSNVAISRELIRVRLAMLYMVAGDLDRAEAMTAEVINAVVAAELRRKIAARRKAGS
jgi:hypothetical protein